MAKIRMWLGQINGHDPFRVHLTKHTRCPSPQKRRKKKETTHHTPRPSTYILSPNWTNHSLSLSWMSGRWSYRTAARFWSDGEQSQRATLDWLAKVDRPRRQGPPGAGPALDDGYGIGSKSGLSARRLPHRSGRWRAAPMSGTSSMGVVGLERALCLIHTSCA